MWHEVFAAAQEAQQTDPAGGGGIGWSQVLLAVIGPAGLIGSIVALFKLKPDANSQAVTQAQGAAAEWQKIADDRKSDNVELERRLEVCQIELQKLRQQLYDARHPLD